MKNKREREKKKNDCNLSATIEMSVKSGKKKTTGYIKPNILF